MTHIIMAGQNQHLQQIRELFQEYLQWANARVNEEFGVNFDTDAIIEADMRTLDKFMPPKGCLLLADVEDRPVGIACLKALTGDIGEVKRMYVRPQARNRGLGRGLLDRLLAEARLAGYGKIRLDSARFMTDAHRLYRMSGFREIEPYEGSEIPKDFQKHWVFMELDLSGKNIDPEHKK